MPIGRQAPRATFAATILTLLVLAIAACGSPAPSGAPSSSPGGSGQPGPSTSAGAATPSAEPVARALVIGCISIDAAECQFVAERIVANLPADRGAPFSVEIQLYQCEQGPCPRTLGARTGKAVVEFTDGKEPIDLFLQGPPIAPQIAVVDGFYLGLSQPSSPRVDGQGPFPFELGHCGLSHVIDFDGSYWVPVGQVDGDHPAIINAEPGQMRLILPGLAEFRGQSGFAAQLARFPGAKFFWGCD